MIGSPFADLIIGSAKANHLEGGGGADVLLGLGGDDVLVGGAEGDYLEGGNGSDSANGEAGSDNCAEDIESLVGCEGTEEAVTQRDRSKISVGLMTNTFASAVHRTELYLVGSNEGRDNVSASFWIDGGGTGHVTFVAQEDSAVFNQSGEADTANCTYKEREVDCALAAPPDAIVMAGMGGDDHLSVAGGNFWETASTILLGGEGNDYLQGNGSTEDVLVDGTGTGSDELRSYGFDDFLTNNEGADVLQGGDGNDLLLSASICGGDTLQGAESGNGDGSAQNSASWAKMPAPSGVTADLQSHTAGNYYSGGPACTSGSLDQTYNIDDLEGSSQADALFGDGEQNNILGRLGQDGLYGRGGSDRIEAVDGEADNVGGGGGTDDCFWDDGVDTVGECDVATSTYSTIIQEVDGQPGYVSVDGHVFADVEGISMNGTYVKVRLFKKEGGTYKIKAEPVAAVNNNYYRLDNWPVGVGEWQVKTLFYSQGTFEQSLSNEHAFTVVANGWHSNDNLGGYITADPDISSEGPGKLDIFGRGASGGLWIKSFSGSWGEWVPMGGSLLGGPGAVSWGANRIDLATLNTSNSVDHWWWNGSTWGVENLGGYVNADPDISSWAPNRLDVFARGGNDNLHHKYYAGAWSGWGNLGGPLLVGGPSAVSWGSNRIDVAARLQDNSIGTWYWNGSGWYTGNLAGTGTSDPDIASWSAGRLDLFVRGADNGLWHRWYPAPGNVWSAWEPLGGYITSGPSAVSWGANRIDIVARAADNSLTHWWYEGS